MNTNTMHVAGRNLDNGDSGKAATDICVSDPSPVSVLSFLYWRQEMPWHY